MLRVLLLLLLIGTQTHAGPWPRGEKKVFFSFHANTEVNEDLLPLRQYKTIYAEYGVNDRVTIGLDFSGNLGLGDNPYLTPDAPEIEKAIFFARIPIPSKDRLRYSVELGIGVIEDEVALRPGFSLGRGVTFFERNGWMSLDTRLVLPGGEVETRIEADFTFGLSVNERTKVILQLQGGMPSNGDNYLKFAPSIVFERKQRKPRPKLFGLKWRKPRKPRKGEQFVEFGITAGLHNYDNYSAKVGIWREF